MFVLFLCVQEAVEIAKGLIEELVNPGGKPDDNDVDPTRAAAAKDEYRRLAPEGGRRRLDPIDNISNSFV